MEPNDPLEPCLTDDDVRRLGDAELAVLRLCLKDGLEPGPAADLTGRTEGEVRALLARVERWAADSIAAQGPGETRRRSC